MTEILPGPARIGQHDLAQLTARTLDLIVIGGGITGAGVARHAAAAGLDTALFEAEDFAAGTSSRSTKLVHGGLRYLAMGDVALVREGALERKSLLAMAPHLVEPRWMLVPAASRAGYWKLRLGIGLYERLGAVVAAERHSNLDALRLGQEEPGLAADRYPWACRYREYHTDDARLVLATLRAAAASGAAICNRTRVLRITREGPGARVEIRDARTGVAYMLTARVVVNAAGPWIEQLLDATDGGARGAGSSGRALYLSKGIHVVVPAARLPVRNMVMMTAADGRPVFAIGQGEVTYLGTTDTAHPGAAEHWPSVQGADVDYLLATANSHFPAAGLLRGDVVASWAGLRPLIHQTGKAPKEMSRRDEIWRDGVLVTIAGGKLTGFRKMAEAAMAAVAAVLGRPVAMPVPLARLPGGERADLDALIAEVAACYGCTVTTATRLVRLYGSETFDVLGAAPTPLSAAVFGEEIRWAVEIEGATTLEDLVYRRLRLAWFLPGECAALLRPAAAIMGPLLGWTDAQVSAEVAGVGTRLTAELEFNQPLV